MRVPVPPLVSLCSSFPPHSLRVHRQCHRHHLHHQSEKEEEVEGRVEAQVGVAKDNKLVDCRDIDYCRDRRKDIEVGAEVEKEDEDNIHYPRPRRSRLESSTDEEFLLEDRSMLDHWDFLFPHCIRIDPHHFVLHQE